jgi:RecA-family ATPase
MTDHQNRRSPAGGTARASDSTVQTIGTGLQEEHTAPGSARNTEAEDAEADRWAQRDADRWEPEPEAPAGQSAADRHDSLWAPLPSDRFTVEELATLPPPQQFVLKPYLPLGVPCVLQGAGGTSKTGFILSCAIGIALGRPLVGEVPNPGSVLFVSAEDRRDTIRRHLYSASQTLPPDALATVAKRVVVKDLVGLDFKVTRSAMGVVGVDFTGLRGLVEYARQIPDLRLIVLDTLSRTHGGQETNEDFAAYVGGMDFLCRELGVTVLALHHVGKAQMRAETVDQYGGRGGSALSDNCRAVLHLAALTAQSKDAPANGAELIAEGRLLRLSHVKHNLSAKAADVFLQRVPTDAAARLEVFAAEHGKRDHAAVWARVADWLRDQREVDHPTRDTIERECGAIASRKVLRDALGYAMDAGLLLEVPHPSPRGVRKTYLRLAATPSAGYGFERE